MPADQPVAPVGPDDTASSAAQRDVDEGGGLLRVGTLTRREALALLAGAATGRMALTAQALPAVVSVALSVSDTTVVVGAAARDLVEEAAGQVVAVQADGVDPDGRHWEVCVVGVAVPYDARQLVLTPELVTGRVDGVVAASGA